MPGSDSIDGGSECANIYWSSMIEALTSNETLQPTLPLHMRTITPTNGGTSASVSSHGFDLTTRDGVPPNASLHPSVIAEMLFFLCVYLLATELISAKKSKGEVLVFRRGHAPKALTDPRASPEDIEAAQKGEKRPGLEESNGPSADAIIQRQTAIFHWQDVCYDIKIKGETRRILDHVDGWVKPGQLTALMGVSGAGK